MAADLEAVVELMRPLLVNNKTNMLWDYCVIWKLGDDPSRFIEWGACCCSGGNRKDNFLKLKDENGVFDECKDRLIKHPVRTKACEALSRFPAAISLYSGIHGDVLMSNQPRWIYKSKANNSATDNEQKGTQVLIPTDIGLIEFFSTKHLPKDQKTTDYIVNRLKTYLNNRQKSMSDKAYTNFPVKEQQLYDPYSNYYTEAGLHTPQLNFLPPMSSKPNSNYSNYERSYAESSLSNEQPPLEIRYDPISSRKCASMPKTDVSSKKKRKSDIDTENVYEEELSMRPYKTKNRQGPYKSKNLLTERNRRKRIKKGLLTLRALVPNITKMDRVATLGDAADYIEELQGTIINYHEELRAMEEEETSERFDTKPKCTTNRVNTKAEMMEIEVEVEVSKIGAKDFLLKLICEKRPGGFTRLMEAMEHMGLRVTDANVTSLNGSVLHILKVEANRTNIESSTLKRSLIQLVI